MITLDDTSMENSPFLYQKELPLFLPKKIRIHHYRKVLIIESMGLSNLIYGHRMKYGVDHRTRGLLDYFLDHFLVNVNADFLYLSLSHVWFF